MLIKLFKSKRSAISPLAEPSLSKIFFSEREREREREREVISACVRVCLCVCMCLCVRERDPEVGVSANQFFRMASTLFMSLFTLASLIFSQIYFTKNNMFSLTPTKVCSPANDRKEVIRNYEEDSSASFSHQDNMNSIWRSDVFAHFFKIAALKN